MGLVDWGARLVNEFQVDRVAIKYFSMLEQKSFVTHYQTMLKGVGLYLNSTVCH